MNIAIIGAGIVGASFAYELSRRGARVTLIERGAPGDGTSGTTAAYLNFYRKLPEHYGQLHVSALAHWRELVGAIGAEAALHLDGNLYWGDTAAAPDWQGFEALDARARQFGQAVHRVEPSALAPALTPPHAEPARLLPGEGWVEVAPVIERLLAAADGHGLRRVGGTVRSIERAAGGVVVQTAEGERIEADRLVLAAGPQTDELGALLGLRLPVQRKPGVIAISSPLPQPLRHVVFSPGLSFRPAPGGRVLIAVGERYALPPGDWPAAERAALEAQLLAALRQWVPGAAAARIESLRVGVRPIPADGLPLVGFLPGLPEVYLAVSHSGINLGPLFGRLGAAEILDGTEAPALAPYRPQRLLGA